MKRTVTCAKCGKTTKMNTNIRKRLRERGEAILCCKCDPKKHEAFHVFYAENVATGKQERHELGSHCW